MNTAGKLQSLFRGTVIFLIMAFCGWILFGEEVNLKNIKGGDTSLTADFTSGDNSYTVNGKAKQNWEFRSCTVSNSTVWSSGYTSGDISAKAKNYNGAENFSTTISGKIVPVGPGNGPPPPTDYSIEASFKGTLGIDPDEDVIIPEGDTASFDATMNGKKGVKCTWTLQCSEGGASFSEENGLESVSVGPGGTWDVAGFGTYQLTAKFDAQTVSATIRVVKVQSISAGEIVSTSDTEPETAYVGVGDSVEVTATPEPGGEWPEDYPSWEGDGISVGDGETSFSFPTDTVSETVSGTTVTANCGTSSKSINIVVAEIESISAKNITSTTDTPGEDERLYVAVGSDTFDVTATAKPDGVQDCIDPEWSGNVLMEGLPWSVCFDPYEMGDYQVTASYGNSTKALDVVVVEVNYITTGEVTSYTDSPGENETYYIAKDEGGSIIIHAVADPIMDKWPDDMPEWENAVAQEGDPSWAEFMIDTVSESTDGTIITATCGTSSKAIKIVVLPTIEADIKDLPPKNETYASGVDAGSLVLKLNGVEITPTITDIENGKHVYYAPSIKELKTGDNEVSLAVKDNATNETEPAPFTWSFEMK